MNTSCSFNSTKLHRESQCSCSIKRSFSFNRWSRLVCVMTRRTAHFALEFEFVENLQKQHASHQITMAHLAPHRNKATGFAIFLALILADDDDDDITPQNKSLFLHLNTICTAKSLSRIKDSPTHFITRKPFPSSRHTFFPYLWQSHHYLQSFTQ